MLLYLCWRQWRLLSWFIPNPPWLFNFHEFRFLLFLPFLFLLLIFKLLTFNQHGLGLLLSDNLLLLFNLHSILEILLILLPLKAMKLKKSVAITILSSYSFFCQKYEFYNFTDFQITASRHLCSMLVPFPGKFSVPYFSVFLSPFPFYTQCLPKRVIYYTTIMSLNY